MIMLVSNAFSFLFFQSQLTANSFDSFCHYFIGDTVVMARFATECRYTMNKIVRKLEVLL